MPGVAERGDGISDGVEAQNQFIGIVKSEIQAANYVPQLENSEFFVLTFPPFSHFFSVTRRGWDVDSFAAILFVRTGFLRYTRSPVWDK